MFMGVVLRILLLLTHAELGENSMVSRSVCLAGFFCLVGLAGAGLRADELYTRGGIRLVGRIVAETSEYVEFQSSELGTVRVARGVISRLERSDKAERAIVETASPATAAAKAASPEKAAATAPAPPAENSGIAPEPDKVATKEKAEVDNSPGFQLFRGWKSALRFGLTVRRGRYSDTVVDIGYLSDKIDARKREYQLEFRFYRKDDIKADNLHVPKDNNLTGEFRFRKNLAPRWFFQSNIRYYRDPTVNLLNEATQTDGVGYRLLKGKRAKLSVGPAAGIQYADYTTQEGWHFVAGVYQDFQCDLSESFRIREDLYYFQDPWNSYSHAARMHLDLSQRLNKIMFLGLAYDYCFEGEVGRKVSRNQNRLGLNLGVNF
jgi:hypothetical protein